jgi:restriction endonuclease S subunit
MSAKNYKLKEITTSSGLFSGFTFRGKVHNEPNGDVRVIQLKNLNDDYTGINDDCIFVESKNIKPKFILNDGDILFASKGANNYAVVYHKEDNTPTIASSSLFVIQVNRNIAIPDYVAWYINQPPVQRHFEQSQEGTYTMSINRKSLEESPIKIPSLKEQENIAKLVKLSQKEQHIYNRLAELKQNLTQHQLLQTL